MRRALAAAAVAAALVAAPAQAQTAADATPVVGSGSFSTAPELESGTAYGDSIRPGEVLYYAVPLEAGQSLRANLQLGEVDDAIVAIAAYDSVRRLLPATSETVPSGGDGTAETEPAAADTTAAGSDEASGPGTWYVAIIATANAQTAAQYDIPFTLQVDVAGSGTPSPDATPTPSPTPTVTPAPEADDDDPSLGLVAGVGVAGLVLGGLGGARLRRR